MVFEARGCLDKTKGFSRTGGRVEAECAEAFDRSGCENDGLNMAGGLNYALCMSSVAEIEQAIAKLPPKDFVQLERWFDAERNRLWGRELEADAQSGKLRELYKQLQSEDQGQSNVPLVEFLDNEKLS